MTHSTDDGPINGLLIKLSTTNYADKRIISQTECNSLRTVQRMTRISELLVKLSTTNYADKRIINQTEYNELRG
jgi:hypothetical protein